MANAILYFVFAHRATTFTDRSDCRTESSHSRANVTSLLCERPSVCNRGLVGAWSEHAVSLVVSTAQGVPMACGVGAGALVVHWRSLGYPVSEHGMTFTVCTRMSPNGHVLMG